jgi:hypothetical protein
VNLPAPATGPALRRLPLLALGFVALIVGTLAGLVRMGWPMPYLAAGAAALHGPLMIVGFFGVVIALERAVAIGRGWAYVAPLAAGLGTLALLVRTVGAWLHVAGAIVLFAATLDVFRRQRALFTFTLLAATVAFIIGCVLWASGSPVHEVVSWWLAFLVLTIAGERLELSRLRPPSTRAARVFAVILAAIVLALVAMHVDDARSAGIRLFGAALLLLAGWLLRQDVARTHSATERAYTIHRRVPAVGLPMVGGRRRCDARRRRTAARDRELRRSAARAAARVRVLDGLRPRADHLSRGAAGGRALSPVVLCAAGAAACVAADPTGRRCRGAVRMGAHRRAARRDCVAGVRGQHRGRGASWTRIEVTRRLGNV